MLQRNPFGISLKNVYVSEKDRDAPKGSSKGVPWTFGISEKDREAGPKYSPETPSESIGIWNLEFGMEVFSELL